MLVLDDLRMIAQCLKIHNAAVWYLLFGEADRPPSRTLGTEAFFHKGSQFCTVLDSLRVGRETRIINNLFQLDRSAEARPLVFTYHAHGDVFLIFTEKRLVRYGGSHSAPHRLGLFIGRKIFSQTA